MNALDYVVAMTKAMVKNDEEGLILQQGFSYDRTKSIGYTFSSCTELDTGSDVSMRANYIQLRDYLLNCSTGQYVTAVMYVACDSVLAALMSDSVQEHLNKIGIETIPVQGKEFVNGDNAVEGKDGSQQPKKRYVFDDRALVEALASALHIGSSDDDRKQTV